MKKFSVDLENYSLDVLRQGSGQALLLIHGSVSDGRTWQQQIDVLSDSYDVIVPSLRYFGMQPWPDDGKEFGSYRHATDLLALIDHLSLKDVFSVGWSYGGNVALHAAVLNPSVFKNLCLYEPAVGSLLSDEASRELATADRVAMFARTAELLKLNDPKAAVETFLDDAVGQKGAFQSMPEYVRTVCIENASMLNLLFNMTPAPMEIEHLEVPTVIACGKDTRDFYSITAEGLGKQCECIEIIRVSNATHIWPVVEPKAFCKLLSEVPNVR